MAGGSVTAILAFLTGKDGAESQVTPTNPLPVAVISGGGGGGGGGVVTQPDGTQLNSQVTGNVASGAADAGNPIKVGGKYNLAPITLADGQRGDIQLSSGGNVQTTISNAGGTQFATVGTGNTDALSTTTVGLITQSQGRYFNGTTWDRARGDANGAWNQGNVASGTADAGFPLKFGGVFLTTQPTVTNGQRVDAQFTARGEQLVALSAGGVAVAAAANNADSVVVSSTASSLRTLGYQYIFNGTTWDRQRGDTAGAYSVTVGSTAAAAALAPASVTNAHSLVVKASAGNHYGGTVLAGAAAGYLVAINAIAAPATSTAITPLSAVACAANSSASIGEFNIPDRHSTGVVYLFTTSLTTYTQAANAPLFMRGRAA